MVRRDHHHFYVFELSKDVLREGRSRRAIPAYVVGKPCVYVGMTALDPDLRFDKRSRRGEPIGIGREVAQGVDSVYQHSYHG